MSNIYFHRGIVSVWEGRGLDWEFRKLWAEADRSRFLPLLDGEGREGQPFPYCIFTVGEGTVASRMSGPGSNARALNEETGYRKKLHTKQVPLMFELYAKARDGDDRAAKTIAEDMALKVMSVYGGHPDPETYGSPAEIPLDFGKVLQLSYSDDYGTAEEDFVHKWTIMYEALIDMPVAV